MDRLPRRMTVVIPIVLAMLTMIGPFMIDTPFPEMARDLGVGSEEMQPVVPAYLVVLAAMSFHGPLFDAGGGR